jgi:growth factor-regulated tyrosine kinase substrate
VKNKVLYLVQVWGIAAKYNPSLTYITGTYNLLQAEGYSFPPVTEKIDSILLETAIVKLIIFLTKLYLIVFCLGARMD